MGANERLKVLQDELRARERISYRLGLDVERPLQAALDGYPDSTLALVTRATERLLREFWLECELYGDSEVLTLEALVEGTRKHVHSFPVMDALREICALRKAASGGQVLSAEDGERVLHHFLLTLEWADTRSADGCGEAPDFELDTALEERARFLIGLYTAQEYKLVKRFSLSRATVYLLLERRYGLRSEYVELILGTQTSELAEVLAVTNGELLRTSYPKATRFIVVQVRDGQLEKLPPDLPVLTYQEFLNTIVDSDALAQVAQARAAALRTASAEVDEPLQLCGEQLLLDESTMTFEVRHLRDVRAVVGSTVDGGSVNLLLVGDAGTGKTRMLTEFAAQPVQDGRYRFFLDLGDRRPQEPIEELVARQLGTCFKVPRAVLWNLFCFLIRSGRCVCLVDAVDEGVPGGSIPEVAALFHDLSVLLSAASSTIVACRQSFLLDTPYVRQLLGENTLLSDKLAGRLIAHGVDPLGLPHFSVIRVIGLADASTPTTPLQRMLDAAPDASETLLQAASREIDAAFASANIAVDRGIEALGPYCLRPDGALSLLELVVALGTDAFEGPPSIGTCRLEGLLASCGADRLRFRHQVYREVVAARFLRAKAAPSQELHGRRISDQVRAFSAELGAADPPRSDGVCVPGNYIVGPPGEARVFAMQAPIAVAVQPVSVGEYKAFLQAVGQGQVSFHPDQPAAESVQPNWSRVLLPGYYERPEYAAYPATCISWWGAWAYANWKGSRLPTSIEWELAARGTDGRLFPWGDHATWDACNCADRWAGRLLPSWDDWKRAHDRGVLKVGNPTEPGAFPGNVSPSGCLDMSGNVWEWTSSLLPNGSDAVIAGGAYDNPIRGVRCSARAAYRRVGQSNVVGFRIMERVDD